jgi:aminoglycoside phosphotransferase family enzyme/predicted kinase
MDLPPLIQALLAPARYGRDVTEVRLEQTHISWVLLAGPFAYKIKKPVKLSFLDFSTLAQRKHYCEEELRLNQRFSPDLYLDVAGIFNTTQDPQWQGSGPPIEYAVRMRRFAQDARLDRICAHGALLPAHMSDLARTVVAFHQRAAIAPPPSGWGSPASVEQQALQNFSDLHALLPDPQDQANLQPLQRWTEQQHRLLAPLMASRQQAGCIRECHGDLHLANLVLLDQKVQLFDCIEFSDALRWIDVASELAFTYVDLLAHGKPGLASWFVNEALGHSGDYASAPLLRFYAVYRALVRAKVALMQAGTDDSRRPEALALVSLAQRLASGAPLQLLITHGVSGCGKTTVTDHLLQADPQAQTLRLRLDVERKRLFGLDARQASGSGLATGIYTREAGEKVYAHVLALAQTLLQANWSVIVDGTFLQREQRDRFRQLAGAAHANFSIVAPQAAEAELRQRVQARQAQSLDASEATLAVLEQQLQTRQPLAADEPVWTGSLDAGFVGVDQVLGPRGPLAIDGDDVRLQGFDQGNLL